MKRNSNVSKETPSDRWDLDRLSNYIRQRSRTHLQDVWRIGKALSLVRGKLKAEGGYDHWLKELGFPKTTAYYYRTLAESYTLEEVKGKPLCILYEKMSETAQKTKHVQTRTSSGKPTWSVPDPLTTAQLKSTSQKLHDALEIALKEHFDVDARLRSDLLKLAELIQALLKGVPLAA